MFVCMPVFLVLAARVSNVCVCILSNCQPFNSSQCPTENKETLGIHLRVVGDWTGGLTHTHTHTQRKEWHTVSIPYQSWQDGSCFVLFSLLRTHFWRAAFWCVQSSPVFFSLCVWVSVCKTPSLPQGQDCSHRFIIFLDDTLVNGVQEC